MATYRKRGASWRAEVAKGGVRESATFDTKAEAVSWATQLESQIIEGKRRHYARVKKTLADAMTKFEKDISPSQGKHAWNCTRLAFFREEMDFVGELVRNVKPEQISAWRDARLHAVKSSTVNRDLNLLSAVFEAARTEWKWIPHNPVHDVKRPKNPPSRNRRVSDAEVKLMTDALRLVDGKPIITTQQYTAIAFLLAIETGMRQGEILALTWGAVFLDRRYVNLPKTKNGDARDVPLSRRAHELLQMVPRVPSVERCFPVNQGSVDALWRKTRAKVAKDHPQIADLNFHDSRHEATTRLSRKLDVLALAKMIGHRDIQSLMIYYNETAAELAARLD